MSLNFPSNNRMLHDRVMAEKEQEGHENNSRLRFDRLYCVDFTRSKTASISRHSAEHILIRLHFYQRITDINCLKYRHNYYRNKKTWLLCMRKQQKIFRYFRLWSNIMAPTTNKSIEWDACTKTKWGFAQLPLTKAYIYSIYNIYIYISDTSGVAKRGFVWG